MIPQNIYLILEDLSKNQSKVGVAFDKYPINRKKVIKLLKF